MPEITFGHIAVMGVSMGIVMFALLVGLFGD